MIFGNSPPACCGKRESRSQFWSYLDFVADKECSSNRATRVARWRLLKRIATSPTNPKRCQDDRLLSLNHAESCRGHRSSECNDLSVVRAFRGKSRRLRWLWRSSLAAATYCAQGTWVTISASRTTRRRDRGVSIGGWLPVLL